MKKLDITKKQLRIIEWGAFSFFCLVGLLMPNSVEQWGIAQAYTNFVSSFVPFINNLLEHPHLPFRLAFYYAILVIPFCFFAIFYFYVPIDLIDNIENRLNKRKKQNPELRTFTRIFMICILIILFLAFLIFFGKFNGSGFSKYDFLFFTKITSSSIGLYCYCFFFTKTAWSTYHDYVLEKKGLFKVT